MRKNISAFCKDSSFTLKGGYVSSSIEDIHTHNQNISTGTGAIKPLKGKGSYSRKEKHRKSY